MSTLQLSHWEFRKLKGSDLQTEKEVSVAKGLSACGLGFDPHRKECSGVLVYNPSPEEVEIGKSLGSVASQPSLISRLQINKRPCEELLRFPLPHPTCMSKHTHRQVNLHKHTQTQGNTCTFMHTHAHKRETK